MSPNPVPEPQIVAAKRTLRAEMRRRRAALPDRAARSAAIWANVLELCARAEAAAAGGLGEVRVSALRVMAFHGVGSEPDTSLLIERLWSMGFTALLPRVEGDHIVAVVHRAGDQVQPGAHGIPAPVGPAVDPSTIDVVLVPGLAFTPDGRRLGQGGGYYDRFLPLLRPGCITCGVCFAEQVVDDLPVEPHDRPLAALITDANPAG